MLIPYGLATGVILILDLLAIVEVVNSSLPSNTKLMWLLLILVLPVGGVVLWLVLGNKRLV